MREFISSKNRNKSTGPVKMDKNGALSLVDVGTNEIKSYENTKLSYNFDMSKYSVWDEATFQYFKTQIERQYGDRPLVYKCLIQLAILDKFI
jgi:hypothetical protein